MMNNDQIMNAVKECILNDTDFSLADYRIGDKVKYLPKLSGFNKNNILTISKIRIETHNIFGEEYSIPKYVYSFENISLSAYENQITYYNDNKNI